MPHLYSVLLARLIQVQGICANNGSPQMSVVVKERSFPTVRSIPSSASIQHHGRLHLTKPFVFLQHIPLPGTRIYSQYVYSCLLGAASQERCECLRYPLAAKKRGTRLQHNIHDSRATRSSHENKPILNTRTLKMSRVGVGDLRRICKNLFEDSSNDGFAPRTNLGVQSFHRRRKGTRT